MLRNLFGSKIKRFYSVENLVQKPVGEQDKTHEFSLIEKENCKILPNPALNKYF